MLKLDGLGRQAPGEQGSTRGRELGVHQAHCVTVWRSH